MKDNIIDGDVLWGTVGYPEWKCEGIRVENPNGNTQMFLVGTSEVETLGLIDNTMLGVADSSKLGKIGINASDSEVIKEVLILGFKDNIIDGDVIWTANFSPD